MAEQVLAQIGAEVQARWPGVRASPSSIAVGRPRRGGDERREYALASAHRPGVFDAAALRD